MITTTCTNLVLRCHLLSISKKKKLNLREGEKNLPVKIAIRSMLKFLHNVGMRSYVSCCNI